MTTPGGTSQAVTMVVVVGSGGGSNWRKNYLWQNLCAQKAPRSNVETWRTLTPYRENGKSVNFKISSGFPADRSIDSIHSISDLSVAHLFHRFVFVALFPLLNQVIY